MSAITLPKGWAKSRVPDKFEKRFDDSEKLVIEKSGDGTWRMYGIRWCGSTNTLLRGIETPEELFEFERVKKIDGDNWREFSCYDQKWAAEKAGKKS